MKTLITVITPLIFISGYAQKSALAGNKSLKNTPTTVAMFKNSNVFRTYDVINNLLLIKDVNGNFFEKASEQQKFDLVLGTREFIDYKIIREADGLTFIKILPCVKITKYPVKDLSDPTKNKNGEIEIISAKKKKCPDLDDDDASKCVFAVESKNLNTFKKVPISSRLVLSPVLHPIKYRPTYSGKESNLTGEITLSFNFGYRMRINANLLRPKYLTFVPYGIGLSNSQYFKKNTNDKPVTGNISLTYWSSGGFLTFDKFNIGVFIGKDAMMTKSQKDWHYQDRIWYSFGFGYKIKE